MKLQLLPPFSPVKNNKAKKHKRKSTSVEPFYDEEVVAQPSAASETVACRYLRPAGDSPSKSCCWLFPMSESSAPAAPSAAHSWFVLDFMVHGGPQLFPWGDYGAWQMASRMHLGAAVAPASTPGLHLQPRRRKTPPDSWQHQPAAWWEWTTEHNWRGSGDGDQSCQVWLPMSLFIFKNNSLM